MLTEIEQGLLADLIDSYGLKGVVDALAAECVKRTQRGPGPGDQWLHDAMALRHTVDGL
jgi:hypothetical protein